MSDYSSSYSSSYLLAVGINSYQSPRFSPLGNAEADAQAVADLLSAEPYHFSTQVLLGEQATRGAIVSILDELEQTQPDDRIILYFSGHGYTLIDNFGSETGYLACADTQPEKHRTALRMDEVTGLRAHAPAKHIAFIFDACFSGQALGLTKATVVPSSVEEFLRRRTYQVISAGAPDQTVSDFQSMTGELLNALQDPTDLITLDTLGLHLKQTIPALSRGMQIPQYGQITGSQGGDMVLYAQLEKQPIDFLPEGLRADLLDANPRLRFRTVSDSRRMLHDTEYGAHLRLVLEDMLYTDPDENVRRQIGTMLMAAGDPTSPDLVIEPGPAADAESKAAKPSRRRKTSAPRSKSTLAAAPGSIGRGIRSISPATIKRWWRAVLLTVAGLYTFVATNFVNGPFEMAIPSTLALGLVGISHLRRRYRLRGGLCLFLALAWPTSLILGWDAYDDITIILVLAVTAAGLIMIVWSIIDAARNKYV